MAKIELSEKAKENLRRNEESRKKESKYVKLESGEKRTLHFDAEKVEPVHVRIGFQTALLDKFPSQSIGLQNLEQLT